MIENGAGYDTFLSQLLGATSHPGRIVISAQRVLGATGPDVNPHFWYDIPQVPQIAHAIEAALARLDPCDASAFAAGLARFDRSLPPAEAVIAEIRRRYRGAPVAYTERVPGYLLQAAGLTVKTPPGFAAAIEDGVDPGPGDTAVMNGLITGHKVKVLLYNAQGGEPADPACPIPCPAGGRPGGGGHRDHAALLSQLSGVAARPGQRSSACAWGLIHAFAG